MARVVRRPRKLPCPSVQSAASIPTEEETFRGEREMEKLSSTISQCMEKPAIQELLILSQATPTPLERRRRMRSQVSKRSKLSAWMEWKKIPLSVRDRTCFLSWSWLGVTEDVGAKILFRTLKIWNCWLHGLNNDQYQLRVAWSTFHLTPHPAMKIASVGTKGWRVLSAIKHQLRCGKAMT